MAYITNEDIMQIGGAVVTGMGLERYGRSISISDLKKDNKEIIASLIVGIAGIIGHSQLPDNVSNISKGVVLGAASNLGAKLYQIQLRD